MPSILFVFTSADETLLGEQTGYYLPEAAHPYYVLAPHCDIVFASPKGAKPPIDEGSVKLFAEDKECAQWMKDETVQTKLTNAKKLSEAKASDYDAVFYPGGLGPAIDLPFDSDNHCLAADFYHAGKIIAAVCHGPAALVGAIDKDGVSLFKGKKSTAFSNEEEEILGTTKAVQFSIEDKIKEAGGLYEKATEPWGVHVVIDGTLITGQNPASSRPVGEAVLGALRR